MSEPKERWPGEDDAASGEETVAPALPTDIERPEEEGEPNGQPV